MTTLKHGYAGKLRNQGYGAFAQMLHRCNNPKHSHYNYYGGRGIKVCDEWNHVSKFPAFIAYMGNRPSPKHSIDRINNDGNYEPGNVRWVTRKEQMRNTRRTRFLTFNGVTLCVTDWAERYKLKPEVIYRRLSRGWPVENALSAPIGAQAKSKFMVLTPEQRRERVRAYSERWRRAKKHPMPWAGANNADPSASIRPSANVNA